jgi:hypothetical protein
MNTYSCLGIQGRVRRLRNSKKVWRESKKLLSLLSLFPLNNTKGGQIKEEENSVMKDPIWRVRSVEDKINEERTWLKAFTVMLYILPMLVIWVLGSFRFTFTFVMILVIAAPIYIIIYKYYSGKIVKDSWKFRSQLSAKCHSTQKGFWITQKELMEFFKVHGIEMQKSANLWDIDRKLIAKSGETLVIFERRDRVSENVTIEIFESKEYPKAQILIKEFFDVALFTDTKDNVYLKTSNESKGEIIKDKEKAEVLQEIKRLRSDTGTPWFIYLFCLYGMVSTGTIAVVAFPQALEYGHVLALGVSSVLLFIFCLMFFVSIYNMNKRDRNRLKELEKKIRTM